MPLEKGGHMETSTDQFVHDQNIHRYRGLLGRVTDESQRKVLLELLAKEEARQADRWPPDKR